MINKITLQKEIKKKIKKLSNSNLIILTGKSLNKLLNIRKIKNEDELAAVLAHEIASKNLSKFQI